MSSRRKADDEAKSSNWRRVVRVACLEGGPPPFAFSRLRSSLRAPTSSPTSESRTCFLFFVFVLRFVLFSGLKRKSEFFFFQVFFPLLSNSRLLFLFLFSPPPPPLPPKNTHLPGSPRRPDPLVQRVSQQLPPVRPDVEADWHAPGGSHAADGGVQEDLALGDAHAAGAAVAQAEDAGRVGDDDDVDRGDW